MKRFSLYLLFITVVLSACQKGIHWDLPSEGELAKDVSGNCLPIVVDGNFIVHKQANDSNFLTVSVTVTSAGTFSIISDSINGYMFKAQGVFNKTGTITTKLSCTGTPINFGTDHFLIHYNNSICEATVIVASDSIPVSNYVLQGSGNNCMNDSVEGNYLKSVALDTTNKIDLSVNVITAGSYHIQTDTVNGYYFSDSGIFSSTGLQTITIKGSGTPSDSGNNYFNVSADNTACNLSVHVYDVVSSSENQLHYPLTSGSYWMYINQFNDTTKRYVNGDTLINNTQYVRVSETSIFKSDDYFFNYANGIYNEFGEVEKYNSSFGYSPGVFGLIPFLKEYLSIGDSWESDEFKGTASFGQVLYFKYVYYCSAINATKIINGIGFKNVYVINVYPQLKSEGNSWGNTNEYYRYYYAAGVGLINVEVATAFSSLHSSLQLVKWKVN